MYYGGGGTSLTERRSSAAHGGNGEFVGRPSNASRAIVYGHPSPRMSAQPSCY